MGRTTHHRCATVRTPLHPEEKCTMTDFQFPRAQDAELQRALQDPAPRHLRLGALAAGAAARLPWQMAGAQTVGKSPLAIASPVDVPTWDPNALSLPAIHSLYQSVFDSPLRYSPQLKLEPRQVKEWKWLDNQATPLAITPRDDTLFHHGTRRTMPDVRYSLAERAQADKKLLVGGMLNTLSDIELSSPTKGVIVFNRPTPAAPIYLAFLAVYVVPRAYMEKVGAEGFNAKPI